jgi:hypothetical protein
MKTAIVTAFLIVAALTPAQAKDPTPTQDAALYKACLEKIRIWHETPEFQRDYCGPPPASTKDQSCVGTLHRFEDGTLALTSKPEGTCRIAKADQALVLRGCKVDKPCTVFARDVTLCEDAGECVDIHNVTAARQGIR